MSHFGVWHCHVPPSDEPPALSPQETAAVLRAMADAAAAQTVPIYGQRVVSAVPDPLVQIGAQAVTDLYARAQAINQQAAPAPAQNRRAGAVGVQPAQVGAQAVAQLHARAAALNQHQPAQVGAQALAQLHARAAAINQPQPAAPQQPVAPQQPTTPQQCVAQQQHAHQGVFQRHYLGPLNVVCRHCGALHWMKEQTVNSSDRNPKFGTCCNHGKVQLPHLSEPPAELLALFEDQTQWGKEFHKNISSYNAALAFTYLGCKLDPRMEEGGGPYSFRINNELYHLSGTFLPQEGEKLLYAQLYNYDPATALNARISHRINQDVNRETMALLPRILLQCDPYVAIYKQAHEILQQQQPRKTDITVRIHFSAAKDQRRYNLPTSDEIAVVLPGDGSKWADN
jgi:hypothetical protein